MIEVGSKPVVVTALGAQDGGNWTAGTIQVGLWDSEGSTLIANAFVSNTSPADAGGYRYSAITPVTLQANTRYIIGALGGTGYANFYDGNNATLPFTSGDSNITIVVSTYNDSDFFSAPTWTAGGGAGGVRWAFANFKFDSGRQLVVWGDSPITTHPVMNAGVSQAVIASESVGTNVIAVLKNGGVTTWSLNGDPVSALDAPESTLADVVLLTAGEEHFLALKKDGQVVAWGRGFTDEGAVPNFGQSDVPYDASSGMVAVAAGDYHSLALRKNGQVFAWGWDNYNQCQVPAAARSGVVAIAAGRYTSFALKFDGTLVSWGRGSYGATLPADATNGVVAISAGRQHAMALKSDGTVKAWGTDAEGQVITATGSPVGLSEVTAVAAGRYYSMALKSDRTVQAWGESGYISDSFTAPAGLANVVSIQGGRNHGLAIVSDGPAPRLDLPLGPLQILAGSATNLPLKSTVPSPIFSQVGLPAGATLSPAGALSVSNTVSSTNVFTRIMVENENGSDARVVKLQITGNTNSIFAANFNDFTGTPTDKQYQTDHDLVTGANLSGWTKTGTGATRLVNHGAAVADWAVMIYSDDTITMASGVDANASGVTYRVSLDVGPSADKNNSHSTRADEILRVLVLDGEGAEIGELPVSPGAWAGSQTFVRRTFTYTGNGNGAVCLKLAAANPSASRIAGAVDNITIAVAPADSDGDGYSNDLEISLGTDPDLMDPAPTTVGSDFSFDVAWAGDSNFTATGLPAGLTISSTTGRISGVPLGVTSGTGSVVTVTGDSFAGGFQTRKVLIRVDKGNLTLSGISAEAIPVTQTLSTSVIEGIAKNASGVTVAGNWEFRNNANKPLAGANSYSVIFRPSDGDNYHDAYGIVTLTGTAAPLPSVTFLPPLSLVYDKTGKTHTATASGVSGFSYEYRGRNDTLYAPTDVAPENAGDYVVKATSADPNYTGSAEQEFTITKASATVTLANLSQTYTGSPKPVNVSVSPVGVLFSVQYNGGSTVPTNAGDYPVLVTVTDPNYSGSKSGTLSVAKANPTVSSAPTLSTITYGQALSAVTFSGGVSSPAGTFAFVNPGATPGAGVAQEFEVRFTPADTANYNPGTQLMAVTVNKKELTVTAENKARNVGEDNPLFTVTITGFVLGEDKSVLSSQPTAYSEANVDSPAGAYDILVEGGASANYTFNRVKGTLTVNDLDPDGDGLDTAAELAAGTDPAKADTDGDGVNDGAEVAAGTNPLLASSNPLPVIGSQPAGATKTYGDAYTFSVGVATNNGPFGYQWRKDGVNVSSATNSSLVFSSLLRSDAGAYDVIVTNTFGAVTSAVANLTVNPAPLTITGISIANKPFDGTKAATITGTATYVGLVNGETFAVTGTPVAVFNTPDVGNSKSTTVSGYTAPNANYTVTQPSGLTANITATAITDGNITLSGTTEVATNTNGYTSTGTLRFGLQLPVEYLVVAGGGAGGGRDVAGGGGAGGVLDNLGGTPLLITGNTNLAVTVGAGGTGVSDASGNNGGNSSLGSVTAVGGGGGGYYTANGKAGGSGGGGGRQAPSAAAGGAGTAGQGNSGGSGANGTSESHSGGGGGGAGAAGQAGSITAGGRGGDGRKVSITGSDVYYGGGGGGSGHRNTSATVISGQGGQGGGGAAAFNGNTVPIAGQANTGGGGGASRNAPGAIGFSGPTAGANGGSGVVMVRYPGGALGTGGTISNLSVGGTNYTLHRFTNTGSATLALTNLSAMGVRLTGGISGSGGIQHQGPGTLTLASASTYSGPSVIDVGATLQLEDAGTLGSGNVTNNGTLVFNLTSTNTFANLISGTGDVQHVGTGTTTLTAANNYTGTTTVAGGVLDLDGSPKGALYALSPTVSSNVVVVTNGGSLKVNNWNAGSTGSLGLLPESSDRIYVNDGTLIFGNTFDSVRGFRVGPNGATIRVTVGGSGTNAYVKTEAAATPDEMRLSFANGSFLKISGSGNTTFEDSLGFSGSDPYGGSNNFEVRKEGTGTLRLNKTNFYTGETKLNAGTTIIGAAGSIASSAGTVVADGASLQVKGAAGAVTVNSGAQVEGSGAINSLSISSGGILKITAVSTNSAGAWNTGGSITFASGATVDAGAGSLAADKTHYLVRASSINGTPTVLDAGNFAVSTTGNVLTLSPKDTDNDGLPDFREGELGTNPSLADTDGDGVNDNVEVADGTSPINEYSFKKTQSFDFTGSFQAFTVPAGVSRISFTLQGADGADFDNVYFVFGGQGGTVTGTVAVKAGDILQLGVGGGGIGNLGGWNGGGSDPFNHGGGGGGATDIFLNTTDWANLVAIAGGGSGGNARDGFGGNDAGNGPNNGTFLNGSNGNGGGGGGYFGGLGGGNSSNGGGGTSWVNTNVVTASSISGGSPAGSNGSIELSFTAEPIPAISQAPLSTNGTVNGSVSFSVTAANPSGGTAGLTYQWSKDGAALSGETNNTLNLSGLKVDRAGDYRVAVSNSFGSVTSSIAKLTVNKATPVISAAPTASAIIAGETLGVSALSGGSANVPGVFAWTTPSAVASASGSYEVTFTPTDAANYTTAKANVNVSVNPADTDGDGLTDAQEAILGTNPDLADSDSDGISDGAEVAAGSNPLVKNILRFRPIDMLALGKGNFSIPESNVVGGGVTPTGFVYSSSTNAAYYGGVPFFVTDKANQVWHAAKAPGGNGTGVVSETFPIAVNNVYGFYTMAGLWWGAEGSYVTYTFNFSDGSSYSKSLTNNVDLRDFNIPSVWANSINGTTTQNVFAVGTYYLDRQWIDLAAAGHGGKNLVSFTVTDSGADASQDPSRGSRIFLAAATAQVGAPGQIPPGATDTDGDGILDSFELGLPLSTKPDDADTDDDGLSDGTEISGTTDPLVADTDGDGLIDGVETKTGSYVSSTNTGTDPTKVDTDGDGLNDNVETASGTFVSAANPGTNPNLADSDGDGVNDGAEIAAGTSPVAKPAFPAGTFAVTFNGTSTQRVISPRPVQDDFTLAFWIKTTQAGTGSTHWFEGSGLLDGEVGGVTNDYGTSLMAGGKVGFGVGNPDITLISAKSVNNNAWRHVAVTREALTGAMKIYIDGVLDRSGTGPTGTKAAPLRLTLGSLQTDINYFAGEMADFRIYDRVINAADVWLLANRLSVSGSAAVATLLIDADADGLDDAIDPDPTKADTDGDGLTDGQEVNTYGSNPVLADTDGDGAGDKLEADLGSSLTVANVYNRLINGSFEDGSVKPNPNDFLPTHQNNVPGWKTSANNNFIIELWGSGFLGSSGNDGNTLVELNYIDSGMLYQDVTMTVDTAVSYSFLHRARSGTESIEFRIDRLAGGPGSAVDINFFTRTVATGTTWTRYHGTPPGTVEAGKTYRFSYISVIPATGGAGNLLDAASFEIDRDADGLTDSVETKTGTYVSLTNAGTDPLDDDSDNDGLKDGEEVFNYTTNPLVADSDSDGALDGVEVTAGTNPKLASSLPKPVISSQPAATIGAVGGSASFSVTAANPAGVTAGPTYQWRKNGETIPGETGSTLNLPMLAIDSEGEYSVVVSNTYGPVTSSAATLMVNKATPAIETAPVAGAITYGEQLSAALLAGGVAKVGALEVEGFFSFDSGDLKPAGGTADQDVTFTPLDPDSYNPATLKVAVTVNKKALTVKANDQTRFYGQANPTLTVTYTGLVAGESSITPAPSVTTSATASSFAGTYPIAVTGLVHPNYDITYLPGTLTVRDGDQDGDGVGDSAEIAAGTDPANPADRPMVLSAGWNHTLFVPVPGQTALAWGINTDGRCGLGHTNSPVTSGVEVVGEDGVTKLSNVIAVAAGGNHSLILTRSGSALQVWAAGTNGNGQLGLTNAGTDRFRPILSGLPTNITAVAAGARHSLALAADGKLYAWGDNISGQVGVNTNRTVIRMPTLVTNLGAVTLKALRAGAEHSLALDADGKVWSWGRPNGGALGYEGISPVRAPQMVTALTKTIVQIAAGDRHSLFLTEDGEVYASGINTAAQLGLPAGVISTSTPTKLNFPAGTRIKKLVAGLNRAHAIATDGKVFAWGYNRFGELGLGFASDAEPFAVFVPTEVPSLFGSTEIAGGGFQTFALDSSGSLLASGLNDGGQLGVGSTNTVTTNAPAPTKQAGKSDQTLTFNIPTLTNSTATSIVLNASTDSGLTPVYSSSAPAVAAVEGSSLRFLTAGTVRITATQSGNDLYNAAAPVTRELTVVPDTTLPVVTLNGPATVSLYVGDIFADPGASALDPADGLLTNDIFVTGTVNTAVVGTYTLTYQVQDAAGNLGQAVRTVVVSEPPPLTLQLAATPAEMTYQPVGTNEVAVDSGLQILGRPSITLTAATVKIVSGRQTGDRLALSGYTGPVTASYNSSSGTLRLSGTTNLAGYQEALRKVVLATTNRTSSSRVITMALGTGIAFTNGHVYEFVSTAADWPTARNAAKARQIHGEAGYLANSTSVEENAFLLGLLQEAGRDGWLGGSDTLGLPGYAWADGPEAGTLFWNGVGSGGSAVAGRYSNWGVGEPNDYGWSTGSFFGLFEKTYESYAMMTHSMSYVIGGFTRSTSPGKWNDAPTKTSSSSTYRLGYLVEYGSSSTTGLRFAATRTIEVVKATPLITALPTATAITTGQTLNTSTLSGGAASVSGTFTWSVPTVVPPAGTNNYGVTFTPTDTANYESVALEVPVTAESAPTGPLFASYYNDMYPFSPTVPTLTIVGNYLNLATKGFKLVNTTPLMGEFTLSVLSMDPSQVTLGLPTSMPSGTYYVIYDSSGSDEKILGYLNSSSFAGGGGMGGGTGSGTGGGGGMGPASVPDAMSLAEPSLAVSSGSGGITTLSVGPAPVQMLFSYNRPEGGSYVDGRYAVDGLWYEVQQSTNLGSWAGVAAQEVGTIPLENGWERVTVRVSASGNQAFLRLKISN